jgi:predicted component of type VI protein secretion system
LSDETPAEDRTQMVRQRTRRRGSWDLVLPTGEVVPATARTLVLGRKPSGGDASVQYVTVDDATRTVSKEHARIEWAGDGWAITDLGSTNGVALVAEDGSERRLAPGVATPLTERFLLGDARLELRAAP